MGKVKKIDDLCVNAIDDIKSKLKSEYKLAHGFDRDVHFTEASKVLGYKYFRKNFGKLKMDEVDILLKNGAKGRRL